jgi:hypothetical protein
VRCASTGAERREDGLCAGPAYVCSNTSEPAALPLSPAGDVRPATACIDKKVSLGLTLAKKNRMCLADGESKLSQKKTRGKRPPGRPVSIFFKLYNPT